MIVARLTMLVGPGILAVGLAAGAASAQVQPPPDTARAGRDTVAVPIPPRPDTLPLDPAARRGPAAGDTVRADTVVTPLARAARPRSLDVGGDYVWDRDEIFESGALTLLDLLERVPGVTGLRAGWLLPPEHASYVGATDRIRVFLDGVERDVLHPRTGGLRDLAAVELWPLEEVMVERAAGELRVHLRSWRVERTTPNSRVDVGTGEYETNVFRGFFGRRSEGGAAIQAGFQQFSTRETSFGGDGDELSIFGRAGWAGGPWSVDGFLLRSRRVQNVLRPRLPEFAELDAIEWTSQLAYLRGGYRSPLDQGLWAQAIVASQLFEETGGDSPPPGEDDEPAPPPDTTRSRAQYVLTGGWNRGALELSATARLRVYEGERHLSPSVRVSWSSGLIRVEGLAERLGEDASTRLDATVRARPLERVELVGAASHFRPDGDDPRPSSSALRGEAGLRVGRTWLVGGVVSRQNTLTLAPVVYDIDFVPVEQGTVTGVYGGARGPVYRDVYVDVIATQWIDAASSRFYRPEQQLRAQLGLDTRWLSRFPRGTFGLRAAGLVEYRSGVAFASADGSITTTLGATVVGGLLEIRIQDATAFVQSRNMLVLDYEQVPGYLMPRNTILYGVRWQFWN